MSLFKTCDWWSVSGTGEANLEDDCDIGCLLVANITNDSSLCDKIVVGSYSGSIRIFWPQDAAQEEGNSVFRYRADHLLLETLLEFPILQLSAGRFVSGNDLTHLCVLHPKHLTVYIVSMSQGETGSGHNCHLSRMYQHSFERQAYCLVSGSFGGVKNKDFIAVQSLDGCISIYEQENLSFSRFLPGHLIPGPLLYVPKSDIFLTAGADFNLYSYKYQVLAVAKEGVTSGKKIVPEWNLILGESAIDIIPVWPDGESVHFIILTLRSFYCFKESGILKFTKKLEYIPSSLIVYTIGNIIYTCVASHTQVLLVYHETNLKWASQLPFVPVAMARASFQGLKGGLVILGENGELQISYLGTDPLLFVAPPIDSREINYEEADKELNQLMKTIKLHETDSSVDLNIGEVDLSVSATVGSKLEAWTGETYVEDPDGVPAVQMVVLLKAYTPLNAVQVVVSVEKPLAVSQDTFVLRTVCDSSQILVKLYLRDSYVPSSLSVRIMTSYISSSGSPKVITTDVAVPLRLIVKPNAPIKEADNKITITTNKPVVNFPELFPDFGLDGSSATALGLQYYGGPTVTILSSRTTQRYRIQSDSISALWVILCEIQQRLQKHFKDHKELNDEKLTIGIASSIPLQDLFSEIDAHFIRRRRLKDLLEQLMQRSTQYRAVQRRLLTKFKDKAPTPLTNLDNLLDGTHKQVLHLTDLISANEKEIKEDECQLSCIIRMVLELLKLQCNLSETQFSIISGALSSVIEECSDQGWEELTDASISFVLRTFLSKGDGPGEQGSVTDVLPLTDTAKLKKHITRLVDYLTKGSEKIQFKTENNQNKNSRQLSQVNFSSVINEEDEEGEAEEAVKKLHDIPVGTRLGEDRARSARLRSARLTRFAANGSGSTESSDSHEMKGKSFDNSEEVHSIAKEDNSQENGYALDTSSSTTDDKVDEESKINQVFVRKSLAENIETPQDIFDDSIYDIW